MRPAGGPPQVKCQRPDLAKPIRNLGGYANVPSREKYPPQHTREHGFRLDLRFRSRDDADDSRSRLVSGSRPWSAHSLLVTGLPLIPAISKGHRVTDRGSNGSGVGARVGVLYPEPEDGLEGGRWLRLRPKRQMTRTPMTSQGTTTRSGEEPETQGYRGWAGNPQHIKHDKLAFGEHVWRGRDALGRGIDAAERYRQVPHDYSPGGRRQDGRRRALPKGRGGGGVQAGKASRLGSSNRTTMAPSGGQGREMLRGEREVFEYWTKVSEEAEAARKAGKRQKAAGRVILLNKAGEGRARTRGGSAKAISADHGSGSIAASRCRRAGAHRRLRGARTDARSSTPPRTRRTTGATSSLSGGAAAARRRFMAGTAPSLRSRLRKRGTRRDDPDTGCRARSTPSPRCPCARRETRWCARTGSRRSGDAPVPSSPQNGRR